ncbi:MAG: FAD-dependent oxidoreductase, partial [Oligoflexia bacterium]|nr:FAD-dependent oxidoreductase [Oligoflexia bacterium]
LQGKFEVGKGEEGDVEKLISLGQMINKTALCGLGKTAANPVLSTIRYFRHEYDEHIRDKKCSVGVCAGLTRASCQSACPAGVDVPGFVSLVKEKCYEDAIKLHRNRNPFATICSRVCFHPCESKCRRDAFDSAVAIRAVKRFMVDQESDIQLPTVYESKENANRRVAIIGAGPAGLSCAYFLARIGYRPVIYESEAVAGGMMVQAIPQYRLPRNLLDKEIKMITEMGVTIKYNKKLGRDFSLDDLRKESFESVFLAVGAPNSVALDIPGNQSIGIFSALDFLKIYNLQGKFEVGKEVIVIGGGNAAIDSARVAKRLGANNVTIVYRRSREDMPAYEEEINDAINEGILIKTLVAPLEVISKNNRVSGLKCVKMTVSEYDRSGRKGPKETEEKFTIIADQIVMAVSQKLDSKSLFHDPNKVGGPSVEVEVDRYGFVKIDSISRQTSTPWLFSGGDAVRGPASVVDAIADGEKAAVEINKFITSKYNSPWRLQQRNNVHFDPDAEPSTTERAAVPKIAAEKRKNNFAEVELGYSEEVTIKQAERCLRCDYGK